jgi:uncharacterized protein (DUF1015 family)
LPLIRPFRALRPAAGQASAVAAPPYDVLDSTEARACARGKPYSFLHISKPEIDLPEGTDPYAPAVYDKGAANLKDMIARGVLIRDSQPHYYVYRLHMAVPGDVGDDQKGRVHVQTGLVVAASVAAYDAGDIRKHEFTRPDKEDDRVRQIDTLNAQTGPVLLVHKADQEVRGITEFVVGSQPLIDVTADDGVRHQLWRIDDAGASARLTAAFEKLGRLYIADGHHRSAAASRVAAARRGKAARRGETETDSQEYFLAVSFPHDELRILDYNRVVVDLNGLSDADFLKRVADRFTVARADGPVKPDQSGRYGMYLGGAWYRLDIAERFIPKDDPVARLDVSLLQDNLITPILGIADPRRDKRIDFVGGIRGLGELQKRVDSGKMKAAFALPATTLDQLIAVADADQIMPPKSTWFEPKLADGLVSHVLD